eukprot:TRINITY_DN27766_c0_g1_i1.p1 TRINITY_DN27766_c0_g1~~TRINITY_DN27766_c0_g1_i1.p1  ORF type:complete len:185 (+),score=22.37 TRINITY_DN27766_c0_g1_i1:159-713(+)
MFVPLGHTAVNFDVSVKGTAGIRKRNFGALAVQDPKLHSTLVSVASNYERCSCVLALRQDELLHVVAVDSKGHLVFEEEIPLIDGEEFQLFHHHIRRSLPTIIDNAVDDRRLKDDPYVMGEPHVRFYAAAPIYSANQECCGTLCIVDNEPRSYFTLNEAEYLRDQATVVANLVQSGVHGKSWEK